MTDESLKVPKMDMKDVNIGNAFQQFVGIMKLDKKVIQSVSASPKGFTVAALFLLVGVSAGPIMQAIFGYNFLGIVVHPSISATIVSIVIALAMAVVGIFVTTLVATKMFNGKGTFAQYFNVVGLAYGLQVVTVVSTILPGFTMLVAFALAIWGLVVGYVVVKEVFKLDNANTVLTLIVTFISILVVSAVLASVFLAMGLSSAMNAASVNVGDIPKIDFSANY